MSHTPPSKPTTPGRGPDRRKPWSVTRAAQLCGLSRSTLLYYDSLGILKPSGRSAANYRLYTESDVERLRTICRYRDVGLTLNEIKQVLRSKGDHTTGILRQRLQALHGEMAKLREQERVIARLLHGHAQFGPLRAMDKQRWVELLRATGLSEEDMDRWHVEFERASPRGHQDFLESLGIAPCEVQSIRAWSREGGHSPRTPCAGWR